jgi:hypothetical protein
MKRYLTSLLFVFMLTAQTVAAAQETGAAGAGRKCRTNESTKECDSGPAWCVKGDGLCSPEMRGRCGKRRGDWYGASQPVAGASEARALLVNYFTGQEYTVSEITEKKWGFRAEIIGKDGKVIDRVMIDKRSGRIRSLY